MKAENGTISPPAFKAYQDRMSSGCIRLMNQDIIDLYARVPVGARVTVINAPAGTGPIATPGFTPVV